MITTVDSHTHLHLLEDEEQGLLDALAAGVDGLVTIGTEPASVERALACARRHQDHVRVGAGLHPNSCADVNGEILADIARLARDELVCAVGETGFDFYHDRASLDDQMRSFVFHAHLARELDLPLIIHTRDADEITLDALATHATGITVVLHCFSMPDHVDLAVERGYMCSFAGNVTYGSADALRDASARVPDELLLAETDAPYLTPVPHRGTRNQPAYVRHTVDVLAEARGMSADECAGLVAANARRVFRLPVPAEMVDG